jgi:hypothetical protein
MTGPPTHSLMPLEDALAVFNKLGYDVSTLSRQEFRAAYYGLARKYQANLSAQDLMATINAAKASIMGLYDWASERGIAAKVERARTQAAGGAAPAAKPTAVPLRDIVRAAMAEQAYLGTRRIVDELVQRRRRRRELSVMERMKSALLSALRRS